METTTNQEQRLVTYVGDPSPTMTATALINEALDVARSTYDGYWGTTGHIISWTRGFNSGRQFITLVYGSSSVPSTASPIPPEPVTTPLSTSVELTPPPSASAVTSTIPSVPAVLGTMTALRNLKLPSPPSVPKISFGIARPTPPRLPALPKIPKMPAAPKIKAINSSRLPNAPVTPKLQLPTKMISPIAALASAISASKLSASGLKTAVAGVTLNQLRTLVVNNLNKTISSIKTNATNAVAAGAANVQSGLANAATPPAITHGIDVQRNIQLTIDLTNRVALQQRSL